MTKPTDVQFTEATLDRLTEKQLHDIVQKTAKDHPKVFDSLVRSLLRSAIRSAARPAKTMKK